MVSDEQPVPGPVEPCAPAAQDGEVWLRQVRPGESATLVAAYREAVGIATSVRVALDRVGVTAAYVVVVPWLTDAGRPAARLVLTAAGAYRFGALSFGWRVGPYRLTA